MTFKLGTASQAQLVGVSPRLINIVNKGIARSGQDFGVHDGLRTSKEQKLLFDRGASKKDGTRNKSMHQKQADGYGHAVDLVPYLPRLGYRWEWNLIYPIAAIIGRVAQEEGVALRWGGVWDMPMSAYGKAWTADEMRVAVHEYTKRHPGPDFIDGPHYELA